MTSAHSTVRALIIYALVLPVALILGLQLGHADEWQRDISSLIPLAVVFMLLLAPFLLKWHHPLLFLAWNSPMVVFFLPGHPQFWLLLSFMSLAIALVQRTLLRDMRFIHAPLVLLPVLFLGGVVLVTGCVKGGFGLNAFGSQSVGGAPYFWIFGAIAGFLAMLSQTVPSRKAMLYVGLFFLGGLTNVFSTLVPYVPPQLYFIYALFPVTTADIGSLAAESSEETVGRYYGLVLASLSLFFYMLAKYGVRDMLSWTKTSRSLLLLTTVVLAAGGGFRSFFLLMGLTFLVVFYFEGLLRTKYAAILFGGSLLGFALLIPVADKLPLSIQRTLSVLPIQVSPIAQYEAQNSTEWRIKLWKIARHEFWDDPWLGKGLTMKGVDISLTAELVQRGQLTAEDQMLLAGNYHSGPLSVILSFGVVGAIGWLWFLGASIRALYLNYIYSDESLKKVNTFLLALFIAKTLHFFLIFGDFRFDFSTFTGLLALDLVLNGGIRRPVTAPRLAAPIQLRPRPTLRPATALPRSSHV